MYDSNSCKLAIQFIATSYCSVTATNCPASQGCRPFVFPLSVVLVLGVVLVQILNYISKVEIVDVDKIFLRKIAEKA